MQCVIYISNKSQYLKNEERYGKTIDGVPLIISRVLSNKINLNKTHAQLALHGLLTQHSVLLRMKIYNIQPNAFL